MNIIALYIDALTYLAIAVGPLSIFAAIFLWRLHHDDRKLDVREHKPVLRLSLVMAVTGTLGAIASSYIGLLAYMALAKIKPGDWVAPLTATVFVGLDVIPLLNAAYLLWLRRRNAQIRGHRSPPPWHPED